MPCDDKESLRFLRCQLTGSRHQQCGSKHCKLTGKYSVQVSNERWSISSELVHTILCNLVEKLAQRTQGTDAGQSSDTADDSKLGFMMITCNITMSRQKTLVSLIKRIINSFSDGVIPYRRHFLRSNSRSRRRDEHERCTVPLSHQHDISKRLCCHKCKYFSPDTY